MRRSHDQIEPMRGELGVLNVNGEDVGTEAALERERCGTPLPSAGDHQPGRLLGLHAGAVREHAVPRGQEPRPHRGEGPAHHHLVMPMRIPDRGGQSRHLADHAGRPFGERPARRLCGGDRGDQPGRFGEPGPDRPIGRAVRGGRSTATGRLSHRAGVSWNDRSLHRRHAGIPATVEGLRATVRGREPTPDPPDPSISTPNTIPRFALPPTSANGYSPS